ncbi:hypothetical protein [Sphingomonas bacterium]|uniref:hypothetical protein n=1 Tax=Sphingomonas bacterium TaxID=1895847 RepID=UPI0015755FD7|nr:hypothetical protein [Sphingomonas bacterium]
MTIADLSTPNWVRWWFRGAAVYGALALLAALAQMPPADDMLSHLGFIGTALAFQFAFWIIGGDPVRHRALMPAAVLEKLAFVIPAAVLAAHGRIDGITLAAAGIDLILAAGFVIAWRATPPA